MRSRLEGDELTGWAIRMAREYRGLDISELADALGVHRNTLSSLERGARTPKPWELHGIASVLRWPVEWLEAPTLPEELPLQLSAA